MKKINTFFGFKNGKLITIIQSTADTITDAIDVDYTVENPRDPEKQIEKWKKDERPTIAGGT